MKTKGLKQFHNEGLVFAINKEMLHPLGMEIQMTQTKRRFSFFDTGKKLIETSLDLNDIYRKFEDVEKSLSKKPKFIQTKMKKQFEQVILDLTKLEQKAGLSIQTGKTKILITREADGHDENEGIVFAPFIKVKEKDEHEFVYEEKAFEIYNNMFKEFLEKEGNELLSVRESKLGYMIQEQKEKKEEK